MLVFRRVSSASRSASSARNGSLAATPCFFSASATRGERMSNRLLAARVPTSRPYGLRLSWPGAQSANPPELMTGRFVRLMRRRDEFGWGRANASRRTSNDGCPVLMALEVVELGDTKEKARTCGRVQQAIRDLYGERSPSVSARSVRPPSDDRFWRYRRLYPKTAFSREADGWCRRILLKNS
jgi:hypothetical protein